ncbi:GIDE domain-containing protein [Thiofaba sp. EF100]|uniref:GIDE domain-containing protein n=1 Tax=Thiofaba sp. EF100 TaxID=3121274 RepID=UPI003221C039
MQALVDAIARDPEFGFLLLFLGGLFLIGMARFLRLQARRRVMEDTPTSRIRSATQGYVELIGQARLMDGPPILSPLSHTACAWWRFKVEKKEKDDDGTRWVVVRQGTSSSLFLLDDGTGECVIDPDGAIVEPAFRRTWLGATPQPGGGLSAPWMNAGDYRYTEEMIQAGERLYALGWFTSVDGLQVSPQEITRDLVIAWKNDPSLRQRFDANGDGRLDEVEFAALREAAQRHAHDLQQEQALLPQTHLLRADPQGRPFLLSTHDQQQLARRLRLHAWLWLVAALAALGVLVHLVTEGVPAG